MTGSFVPVLAGSFVLAGPGSSLLVFLIITKGIKYSTCGKKKKKKLVPTNLKNEQIGVKVED